MRDRDRLRAALAEICDPCPFCADSVAYAVLDRATGRYVVKVVHPDRKCRALVPGVIQDRATAFLASLLELHGIRAAEYCDEVIGWHDWR